MPGIKRKYGESSYSSNKKSRGEGRLYFNRTRGYGFRRWRNRRIDYPERKFFDVVGNGTTTAVGAILANSLNLVSLGNGQNEMIGRKITIKRISSRMDFNLITNTNAILGSVVSEGNLRLILLQDKQANGAAPTVGQVLQSTDFLSLMNMENSKRFVILKEWMCDLSQTVGYNQTANIYFNGSKTKSDVWSKKCNIRIDYSPQAGGSRAITEVRSNNLFLLLIGNAGSTQVSYRFRIRYTDD